MITETITWYSTVKRLPDADITVLIAVQDADGIEVYSGWYAGDDHGWFDVTAHPIGAPQVVTAWAHMPAGPALREEQMNG